LDSLKSGLNQAGQHLLDARGKSAGAWTPASFAAWKSRQLCEITGPGSGADASCQPSGVAQQQPVTSRALNALDEAITAAVKRFNAIRQDLSADETRKIETAIDSLDANQKALAAKLKANGDSQATLLDAAQVLRKLNGESDQAKTYTSAVDDKNINSLGVNRMLTVALSAQDAFTKEKQALATVTAVWGATRFELSTGALFSMVPNRSFQAAQIIQGGQPVRDSSGKINTVLTETTTRPTVVPFGLAHFRLKEWVVGGRRVAALLTGGIGVNTNSSSADFAAGASVLYRSLVISPLFHFTRDQRLTNGLYAGEQLTSSPPALTTERYWVVKFGLAISYRIPIN
jgi:hypothetical protein